MDCPHKLTCIANAIRPGALCRPDCGLIAKLDMFKAIDEEAARMARELALDSVRGKVNGRSTHKSD